jgi:hypothetical protein
MISAGAVGPGTKVAGGKPAAGHLCPEVQTLLVSPSLVPATWVSSTGAVAGVAVSGTVSSSIRVSSSRPAGTGARSSIGRVVVRSSLPVADHREPPQRHRGQEHDHHAQAGEEADLLDHAVSVVADRVAGVPADRPHRAEQPAEREPGSAGRGQPGPEDRDRAAARAADDQAAEHGRRGGQDLQPQAAGGVRPGLIRRIGVVEVGADEGNEPAPDSEQDQQRSSESATAPRNAQHPCHDNHSSRVGEWGANKVT